MEKHIAASCRRKRYRNRMRPIDADHLRRWIIARWQEIDPYIDRPFRVDEILAQIDRELSIDIDRPHGKWIQNDNGTWSCNLCQSWIPNEQHYYARFCLFCGAYMKGVDDGRFNQQTSGDSMGKN